MAKVAKGRKRKAREGCEGPKLTAIPLSRITEWEENPKLHDLAKIQDSIRTFGFVTPVVFDTYNGHLVAGHGRVSALRTMKEAGEAAPVNIETTDSGEWLVPALTGAFFGSKEEAEAYGVADNRLVELGGWGEPELLAMLHAIREEDGKDILTAIGYAEDTVRLLEQIVGGVGTMRAETLPDVEAGDFGRPGKMVLIYNTKRERKEWLLALGVDEKWDGVILTVKDVR